MLTTKKRDAPFSALTRTVLVLALFGGCTPPGPRAVLDGERLIHEGKFDRAIARLEEGARLLPKKALVWNHLGLAYHHAGRADDAIKAYQQALALDRDLAVARYNLGCLHLEQGNATLAITELTTYTVLQPKAYAGWVKLGMAQLRARQLDSAEKSFQQAQRLNARAPEAWNGSGLVLFQRRRYLEARQLFSAALRQQPDYAPALLNLAIVSHQHLNDRVFALQKYREYAALKPPPPDVAEVQEAATRLDAELSPQPRLAAANAAIQLAGASKPAEPSVINKNQTNRATNKPPAVDAAAPATTSPRLTTLITPPSAPTSPRTSVPASPPPELVGASNPELLAGTEAAPPPRQKIEVVHLEDDEPIKPVRDVPLSSPQSSSLSDQADRRTAPQLTTAPTQSSAPKIDGPTQSQPTKGKSGLVTRLNPRNWFRPENNGSSGRPTEVPDADNTGVIEAGKPRGDQTPLSGRSPLASKTQAEIPRYKYRSPALPKPGNRGAAERLVADGVKAQQRGQLSDAVEAYRKAVRADPSFFEAPYNLGVAAFEKGDLDQALTAYEFALAVNPVSIKARFNFAIALQRAEYPRDAANELEKLLAENPSEGRAHFTLARLYAQQLGADQKARAHYLRLLELDPQHPQATAIRFWLEANP